MSTASYAQGSRFEVHLTRAAPSTLTPDPSPQGGGGHPASGLAPERQAEREHPVNAMLDLAEQAIRIVIEHGGEAAMAARCRRLIPDPLVAPADTRSARRPAGAAEGASGHELELVQVLAALRIFDTRRLTAADHAPFTVAGKIKVVGNGVPLPMGRAVATAVKCALGLGQGAEAAA